MRERDADTESSDPERENRQERVPRTSGVGDALDSGSEVQRQERRRRRHADDEPANDVPRGVVVPNNADADRREDGRIPEPGFQWKRKGRDDSINGIERGLEDEPQQRDMEELADFVNDAASEGHVDGDATVR